MNKYQTILADPPWFYNNRKTGGERKDKTKFGGGARKHYPLMKDADLKAMRPFIDELADKDCALFMWATMPRLDFAIELMEAWGFKYKTTAFTWIKQTQDGSRPVYGPGFYTGSNVEVVLIGVRGSMPPVKKMLPSVIQTPRGIHSRKPPEVRELIEQMYPTDTHKSIELFARINAPGWDAWGNEEGVQYAMSGTVIEARTMGDKMATLNEYPYMVGTKEASRYMLGEISLETALEVYRAKGGSVIGGGKNDNRNR